MRLFRSTTANGGHLVVPMDAATLHHSPPIATRDPHTPSKIVAVHRGCNEAAGDYDVELLPLRLDHGYGPEQKIWLSRTEFVLMQPVEI